VVRIRALEGEVAALAGQVATGRAAATAAACDAAAARGRCAELQASLDSARAELAATPGKGDSGAGDGAAAERAELGAVQGRCAALQASLDAAHAQLRATPRKVAAAKAAAAAALAQRAELEAALAEMGKWAEGEKGANQALWASLQARARATPSRRCMRTRAMRASQQRRS